MNIFVINSGSSSIKYQLIQMPEASIICSGLVDRIGLESSAIVHKTFKQNTEEVYKETINIKDHVSGLQKVAQLLTDQDDIRLVEVKDYIANPKPNSHARIE